MGEIWQHCFKYMKLKSLVGRSLVGVACMSFMLGTAARASDKSDCTKLRQRLGASQQHGGKTKRSAGYFSLHDRQPYSATRCRQLDICERRIKSACLRKEFPHTQWLGYCLGHALVHRPGHYASPSLDPDRIVVELTTALWPWSEWAEEAPWHRKGLLPLGPANSYSCRPILVGF